MEIWKSIDNYPNYEVSNEGRVKNVKRQRFMTPCDDKNGYQRVTLSNSDGHKTKKVHRLVASAFHGGEHSELEVNHIDGNKKNNHESNLEWCTPKENTDHAIRNGLMDPYARKPKVRVRVIETGEIYESVKQCAEAIGGSRSHISRCLTGNRNKHRDFHFEYAD